MSGRAGEMFIPILGLVIHYQAYNDLLDLQ